MFLADNCYMKLKLESIRKASQPTRQMKKLDGIVQNFKPVSDHKHNVCFYLYLINYFIFRVIFLSVWDFLFNVHSANNNYYIMRKLFG